MNTVAERTRTRRARFIAAGIPLIGLVDGSPVGVRDVCRSAGLTERYFYQSFGSREQFVKETYDSVCLQVKDAAMAVLGQDLSAEDRALGAVTVLMEQLIDQPANGRVVFLGPATEPVLGQYSVRSAITFVHLVRESIASSHHDEADRHLSALTIVGGMSALFTAYLGGTIRADREQFVEHCVRFLLASRNSPAPVGFASCARP